MSFPVIFQSWVFRADLNNWLKANSTRKLSNLMGGALSPSTISRISTGKTKNIGVVELALICSVIGKKPEEYFHAVLF